MPLGDQGFDQHSCEASVLVLGARRQVTGDRYNRLLDNIRLLNKSFRIYYYYSTKSPPPPSPPPCFKSFQPVSRIFDPFLGRSELHCCDFAARRCTGVAAGEEEDEAEEERL